jgi:TPR repeat protein
MKGALLQLVALAVLALPCAARAGVEAAERECGEGIAQSCFDAGVAYAIGYGAKKDHQKAANLMSTAAHHGHVLGQLNYASMYEVGMGVERDMKTAYTWYQAAARKGNQKAKAKADELRPQLSKPQLQDADLQAQKLP